MFGPDGRFFVSYLELDRQRQHTELRADELTRRAELAEQRASRLAAKLQGMGIDPNGDA